MSDLPNEIIAWVEEVTAGKVIATAAAPSGGRLGFTVDVETSEGTRDLFVQMGRGDISGSSFMSFDQQAEVYRALEGTGIPIPHVWGVDTSRNAFLVDRIPGTTWFHAPRDPAQQVSVAQDFIRHLATWHSVPARKLDLPSFGPVKTVREHQLDQLRGIRENTDTEDERRPIDALARLSVDWLEANVPDYDGDPVLVQGDTGPGNIMYDGDRVSGIIDWELAHLGDPMDDIAWLSWRAIQHGFPDFPARMREYEKLTGTAIDQARVIYYRVNACARLGPRFGLAGMGEQTQRSSAAGATETDRVADGSQFIMNVLHRRMRLEALGAALGIDLPPREIADEAELRDHAQIYDTVLNQLQTMVPRIEDRTASNLAKGVARQIKYLKEIDRNGDLFDRRELDDIGRLLGRTPGSLAEGRPLLAAAARDQKVSGEAYFLYHWRRLVRDDHLMRLASGALYQRTWPALF